MIEPIAEALDDADYRLRLFRGLSADRLNNGEFVATLALARPETTRGSSAGPCPNGGPHLVSTTGDLE
jgi:hypothetical protein